MQNEVNAKNASLEGICFHSKTISEAHTIRIIRQLRKGCAAGVDGLTAEHICYATNTPLPLFLSTLLTVCIQFGCFPDSFQTGRLIPILKKNHLDPSVPKNYRPITVSVVMSKLLEFYILEESSNYTMHPCQFGFVQHRGTTTAFSLAHDVAAHCSAAGSSTYLCSLDAEGAFDTIPHPVHFSKAAGVIPDHCWRVLYKWYTNMSVTICWNKQFSPLIKVKRGTRQGGLSSPFLFNVFYKSLIETLDDMQCGISIGKHHYNVFCYADDVLLASTTVTGLQALINAAVDHVTSLGLRFNPTKTSTMSFGRTLQRKPSWNIQDSVLNHEESIVYLGGVLHDGKVSLHVKQRATSAQKAFYGLQSAGLHFRGVAPNVSAKLYNVGVRTVLMYGTEALALSKRDIDTLKKTQGKLVKSFLGLSKFSRNTPLLSALNIPEITNSLASASVRLLRSNLIFESRAKHFYLHLINQNIVPKCHNLIQRCFSYIPNFNICDIFYKLMPQNHSYDLGSDGLVDSILSILSDYTPDARTLLQNLVSPF